MTAENNAAVLLAQAIDPASIDAGQRERFYKKSSASNPPKKSDGLFSDSAAFLTNQGDRFAETIDTLVPWSPEKFPPRSQVADDPRERARRRRRSDARVTLLFPADRKPRRANDIQCDALGLQPSMEIGRALVALVPAAQRRTHRGRDARSLRPPPAGAIDRQRTAF